MSVDGCPLGTVYFVHHNDWLSMTKILVLRVRRPPINIFMCIKLIESHALQTLACEHALSSFQSSFSFIFNFSYIHNH